MKFLPYILIPLVAIVMVGLFFTTEQEFRYESTQEPTEKEQTGVLDNKTEEGLSQINEEKTEPPAEAIKENNREVKEEVDTPSQESLREIVYGFLGTPYERGPLGEGPAEKIYRTDVFDCTTLVLISASKYNANEKSAKEMMKTANYYPAGEISYNTRLHFTTYRNLVSPFFEDITREIGGDLTEVKEVVLNKERDSEGRLIDIDWQEEIILRYIKKENIHEIKSNIPTAVGVAFMVDGDEDIGLDVRHEGFVFDGHELVHASNQKGEVSKEDFLKFIENSNYSGVLFFKILRTR